MPIVDKRARTNDANRPPKVVSLDLAPWHKQHNIIIWEEEHFLTTITLYKPNGDPITYMEPTNIIVENGTLTFYWVKEISGKAQKIMTNLPFLIQHDVMGH